jgi:sulfur carrier protein
MQVQFNHQVVNEPPGQTLAAALAAQGFKPPYAVAINTRFIPRAAYAHTLLADGDRVEVITPVTGG